MIKNDENKKVTIRKKMTIRDYANLAHYLETGEFEADLSNCDVAVLSRVEIKTMRLTKQDKAKVDKFFGRYALGVSAQSIIDSIPKIKTLPTAIKQVAVPAPVATPVVIPAAVPVLNQDIPIPPVLADEDNGISNQTYPWIVDPFSEIEPGNIDISIVLNMAENGQLTEAAFENSFDSSKKSIVIQPFEKFYCSEELKEIYTSTPGTSVYLLVEQAERVFEKYSSIIEEEVLSEQEQMERYKNYVLECYSSKVNNDMLLEMYILDESHKASNKKIVSDDECHVYDYDNADDMENDVLFLASVGKIEHDAPLNIFGKKTTINKIAQKLYKKYPNGLPGKRKFYHTSREALDDGAINL